MKSVAEGFGYNERLFAGGLRGWLHMARFRWLRSKLMRLGGAQDRVIELGCHDGRAIEFLPYEPGRYLGIDANWEHGLDAAKSRWQLHPNVSFVEAQRVADIDIAPTQRFDVAIAMETLEHIDPPALDGYLALVARHLDGHFLITVPNERGGFFLGKWFVKRLLSSDAEKYSAAELMYATVGRLDRVARDEHKGFDWKQLLVQLERHFDIVHVGGTPLSLLPTSLCFTVGIVARSRPGRRT